VLGIEPGDFPEGGATASGYKRIRRSPGVQRVHRKLAAEGLVRSAVWELLPRAVTLVCAAALLGTGFARLAEGLGNGRPVGNLEFFLVIAVIESSLLLMRFTRRVIAPTALGTACLRPAPTQAKQAQNSSDAPALLTGAMLGVALEGLGAVRESILRDVLQAAVPAVIGAGLVAAISNWNFSVGDDRRDPWDRGNGRGPWNNGGGGSNCGGGSSCGGGGGDGGGGGCGG
jgi:uncharacterized membrane protein YgcG